MTAARGLTEADLAELPSRRDEAWRWTDLGSLVREAIAPSAKFEAPVQAGGPFGSLRLDEIVIANGRLNWWPEGRLSKGLQLREHQTPEPPVMADDVPMARLAARNAVDPPVSILKFEGGEATAAVVRFVSRGDGAHHARLGVVVAPGVKAALLESYEGAGEGYFSNALLEIFVGEGASLERVVLVDDTAGSISASTAEVFLARKSSYAQCILTSGAKRQRSECRVEHPGGHASVRLDGVYLLGGKAHADITTVVTHAGVDGATDQLTKGVVDGQARGVFQGRIVVQPGADRTDAKMGHHALILSDRGEVDAKPELEIFADDISCAHGNTVGALDEDALFYAMQRGLPEADAKAMLTQAFVGEVIDRIEHEGAREVARRWAAQQLGAAHDL